MSSSSQSNPNPSDDPDPDEMVWVAANRGSSKARRFHTNSECHQLKKVENVEERRRDQVGYRTLCLACKNDHDPPGTTDNPCPFCGEHPPSIAVHLREECTDAPGSGGGLNGGGGD